VEWQHHLVFTPFGVLLPQALDSDNKLCGIGRLANSLRMAKVVLQTFELMQVAASHPVVGSLRRGAKIATGETGHSDYGI